MRELIEKIEGLIENIIPEWVKRAAKSKVVEGPNGNKAIAYEWKWMWDEVWSDKEDGLVGVKVSDWDNAVYCSSCNRKIVHVYWVETKEGIISPYGGDHLHIALGYPRELSKSKLKSLQNKVTRQKLIVKEREYFKKNYGKILDLRSSKDIGEANGKFMLSKSKRGKKVVFLWNKKERLIARGDDLAIDRLRDYYPNWEVKSPSYIRKELGGN